MPSAEDQVVARLAREVGSSALAAEVAARLDERALAVLAAEPDLDVTPLLSFTPPSVDEPKALVVFAFGNRLTGEGDRSPGPVNL